MDAIAAICNVPMMRNGNKMINIGSMVNITAHRGNAATPVTIATINVMNKTIETNKIEPYILEWL